MKLASEDSGILSQTISYGILGLLVVYSVVRSVFASATKPLWYDEILTLTVSRMDSWAARMQTFHPPLDGQPPPFYAIEHLASKLSQNQELALRLPSIVAFAFTLICLFVFCRKLAGNVVALVCAALLLTTDLFRYYAVEARPYSLVVACIAFALVCYQRVPRKIWTLLFAVALVLAQSLHYYAIFAMVPFGMAELVYSLYTKKIRWGVWAAFAVGCVPLAILLAYPVCV